MKPVEGFHFLASAKRQKDAAGELSVFDAIN